MKSIQHPGIIQKRILAITVSCLLGICVIISLVSFYIFQNYLQRSLIQSAETNLQLLSDNIDSNISYIYQMIRFCQTNSNISTYIANNPNPGAALSVATYDRLAEEFNSNPANSYITRLAVVTDEHFLQIVAAVYSSTMDLAEEIPKLSFFETLLEEPGYNLSTGFVKDPFYRNGKDILPVIRPITYPFSSKRGGYLFLEISADLFTSAFERYTTAEDSYVYLTIGEHQYLYGDGCLTEVESSYEIRKTLSASSMIEGCQINEIKNNDGVSKIMVSVPLELPGCYISQNISHLELQNQYRLLWCILGGTLISILGMGILLMYILNHMITVPVSRIRSKMQLVAKGDFERDPAIEWKHELGDIGRGVNDLCESVLQLMQTRLEDEKQKKDLEYKMLQSQINPHFIYNTLNSIKWMADIQGAFGISEMTAALAKLLKSISKGTQLLIPIREELSLLQDYFTIQRCRYGGTITMDVQTDSEEILDCRILKFTLQPLVENAIFHGIEPKGTGHISIHAMAEDGKDGARDIRIDVTDNGVGISPEKAKYVLLSNDDGRSDFFREIGISNVHRRLQYEFGEQYGITIESTEGEYTTMSIHLPASPAAKTRSSYV